LISRVYLCLNAPLESSALNAGRTVESEDRTTTAVAVDLIWFVDLYCLVRLPPG